ncbi:MAG: hypothetical protein OEM98_10530 [Gammaproteobacteria bacterium]|nr:hypothetical protein [Gammaproteobacteria bacterium]
MVVLAAVATAAASGCAQIEKKSRVIKLDQAVRLYADSIRWGNFETAAGLVRRRDGKTSAMAVTIPADVRVSAYASNVLSLNEQSDEATVVTSFNYFFTSTNSVRVISQTDLWWFDPTTEQWFMDGSLPDFRP